MKISFLIGRSSGVIVLSPILTCTGGGLERGV